MHTRDAGDEGEVIVLPPSIVAALPPAAHLAVLDRFGVVRLADHRDTARDGVDELPFHEPVVRRIVGDAIRVNRRRDIRRDDVEVFGGQALKVCEDLRVDGQLQDGPAARVARELRVVDLVRPAAELARTLDPAKDVRGALPAVGAQVGLENHRHAAADGRHGARRPIVHAAQIEDVEALGYEGVDVAPLMLLAAGAERVDERIVPVWLWCAERHRKVEAGAVTTPEKVRDVRRRQLDRVCDQTHHREFTGDECVTPGRWLRLRL